MYNKIIVVTNTRFTKWDYDRYGISVYKKNGFDIIIYDCTPVFNKKSYENYLPENLYLGDDCELILNRKVLKEKLKLLKEEDIVFTILQYSYENIFLFKEMRRHNIQYLKFYLGTLPVNSSQRKSRALVKAFKLLLNPIKAYKEILGRLPIYAIGGQYAKYLVCVDSNNKYKYVDSDTTLIEAHTFDYDQFLERTDIKRRDDQIVFLDQYIPFHPDLYYVNEKKQDPDVYYSDLCNFFDRIENKTGKRVIIAAHPRADYSDKMELYGGRDILYGKTADLIAESSFVMAHNSTALSYAVLYQKSIIIIDSKKFSSIYRIVNSSFANVLGCGLYDVNDTEIQEKSVDKLMYKKYINIHIKKDGTPQEKIADIVSNYLKE